MTPAEQDAPDWPGLSVEEREQQQAVLRIVLRWGCYVSPVTAALYLFAYLRRPVWPALALALILAVAAGVCLWGARHASAGVLRQPTTLLLAISLAYQTVLILSIEERAGAFGVMGFPCLALLAVALEPPPIALAWSCVAIAVHAAGLVFPRLVPMPKLGIAGLEPLFDVLPLAVFLLIVLLGRALARNFRATLATHEQARGELERSNQKLEEQRAELQLAQAELSGIAGSLDETNRGLQGFARVVSHELLAPLRQLAEDGRRLRDEYARPLGELGREHIASIVESTHHMEELVTGLLTYARSGLDGAEVEPLDLGALVDRVVTVLDLRSRADFTRPQEAPTVRAHRVRLEQVFSNLLGNALKFQRPGVRPVVAVEWADRGEAWELAVRDNGIGIDPRHFDKIFGIFQRLHLPSEYEGTGLGLAVVKKAIEEHGGKVWVESAPGQGSAFRFTLPKAEPARVSSPGAGEAPRSQSPASALPAALGPEGQRLQRRLVTTALWLTLGITPVVTGLLLIGFFRAPSVSMLLSPAVMVLVGASAAWGLRRLRQGSLARPTRVLLAAMLIGSSQHLLRREEVVLSSGTLGIAITLLFAASLEPPALALRWAWAASGMYGAALILRRVLPLRLLGLGPLGLESFRFVPVAEMGMFILFARSTLRDFREALARSHATRRDLEQVHASLERQRAELLATKARLSELTARLTRSNQELQRFTSIASHDLRAPLRALTNYSRFLQEDCAELLDEQGRAYLQRISAGAQRMDALVSNLLESSRREAAP